jgi:hypothetical protein
VDKQTSTSSGKSTSRPVELADPLWEQQKGESKKAFDAFVVYRDQEKRSYAEVGRAVGKSKTQMDRWGSRWHWVVRVAAYDRERDRDLLKLERANRHRALNRQKLIAVSFQNIAGFRANEILESYKKTRQLDEAVAEEVAQREAAGNVVTDEDKIRIRAQAKLTMGAFEEIKLTARDIKELFHEGVFVERLVLGEPTEHRVDMTADELLRKRISDAVADGRINHSEFPDIALEEHLRWASIDYGVAFNEVLAAAGLPAYLATPPLQLTTKLSEPEESVS